MGTAPLEPNLEIVVSHRPRGSKGLWVPVKESEKYAVCAFYLYLFTLKIASYKGSREEIASHRPTHWFAPTHTHKHTPHTHTSTHHTQTPRTPPTPHAGVSDQFRRMLTIKNDSVQLHLMDAEGVAPSICVDAFTVEVSLLCL